MEGVERAGLAHWAGEPIRIWERRWNVPLFEAHRAIGSTNDRVEELATAGAAPFTVVVAEEQTAGKGRVGRSWYSPPGTGLWMSVLLAGEREGRPPLTPLLVGVAVCRAIRRVLPGLEPEIKWPNDVLLDDRKVCGILCERAAARRTVAGVGLNVRGTVESFPTALRGVATTLEAAAGEGVGRTDTADALLRELRRLLDPVPEALSGQLAREVERLDALRDRPVKTSEGVRGRGAGIAPDGALMLRRDGERRIVVAGSVELVGES